MPVIVTRGNNVFGPKQVKLKDLKAPPGIRSSLGTQSPSPRYQYPEKVVPKFIRRLVNGLPVCIHGDGSNSRHYIYVGDVAAAFDKILHKGSVTALLLL